MKPDTQRFITLLKSNGYSITAARRQLFGLLQQHEEITVQGLISLLDKQNQSTVYRNLLVFERLGIIQRLRLGWNSKLELSDIFRDHHHHATCVQCGTVITLPENPELERHITLLTSPAHFQITGHSLEIRGLCVSCQTK